MASRVITGFIKERIPRTHEGKDSNDSYMKELPEFQEERTPRTLGKDCML
jgi:hypothetical protein